MAPQESVIGIFRNGNPFDWIVHAGGFASLIVAPIVALIALVFWLRHKSMKQWVWFLSALPALTALAEFTFEMQRIEQDIGQVWSRDWNFNQLYASAHARLLFGSAFTVLFLVITLACRLSRRGGKQKPPEP